MSTLDPEIAATPRSLSSSYLLTLLPWVEQTHGLGPDKLLEGTGLSREKLADPQFMVPLYDALQLYLRLKQLSGDTLLGLHIGEQVQPRSYLVLGYTLMCADTLDEALQRLLRYERLAGDVGHTTAEITPEQVVLSWHPPLESPFTSDLTEAAIAGWIAFARRISGLRDTCPDCVYFRHAANGPLEEYQRVFGCEVRFNSAFSGASFPRSLLDIRLPEADPGLSSIMQSHAEALLRDFSGQLNLVNEVRSHIYRLLPSGEPTIEQVGKTMSLPSRTLQSRLKKSQVNFSELVDDVRRHLALSYIRDSSLTLVNAAFLLGFSEQSSFNRAFRRWTGMSPGELRKQYLETQS